MDTFLTVAAVILGAAAWLAIGIAVVRHWLDISDDDTPVVRLVIMWPVVVVVLAAVTFSDGVRFLVTAPTKRERLERKHAAALAEIEKMERDLGI